MAELIPLSYTPTTFSFFYVLLNLIDKKSIKIISITMREGKRLAFINVRMFAYIYLKQGN